MKKLITAISSVTLALFVLAVGMTFAADGPDKTASTSTAALTSDTGDAPLGGGSYYGTGFEVSEGFATGYCGGQAGWTAFVASSVEGHIDTVNPASGDQHARISGDGAVGTGVSTGCFSPLTTYNVGNGLSVVSMDINVGNTGGADYDVVPQTPTEAFLTARVKYSWLGTILILDDVGAGLAFVDTGFSFPTGSYHNLVMVIDSVNNSIDYYVNGTLLYASVTGIVAGTTVEQVVLISDNYQLSESGDFDNVYFATDVMPSIAVAATVGTGTDCSAISDTTITVDTVPTSPTAIRSPMTATSCSRTTPPATPSLARCWPAWTWTWRRAPR